MVRFITDEELKADGFINRNLEPEYLNTATEEAQLVWLKETLGDGLYARLEKMIEDKDVTGIYKELLDEYIKIYLKYKVVSLLCVPLNFKVRNAGLVQQYSNEMNTSTLEDTKYLESYYEQKADFFRNRLSKFLELHKNDIPEYRYCCKQVTNPEPSHPVCGIYLGK